MMDPPRTSQAQTSQLQAGSEPLWVTGEDLLPGDAYQEGPYVVFTAQYHLRRGHCCNSGCRHCPYKEDSGL